VKYDNNELETSN